MRVKWDRTKGRPEPIRLLNLINECENGEQLLDLREACPRVQILRDTVIPYLRQTVCEMLHQASMSMPEGYFLGVVDAWRPFERQQRIYDFIWKCGKEAFPDRDDNSLRRTVCRWVAPTNQKEPPGHCTGAAVDVFLVNQDGEEFDVHSPYGRFGAAPTYSLGLTDDAHQNRNILIEAMLGAGFSNCRDEWWHYSWGDAGWAVRTGETSCVYGLAQMDPASYAESEELHKVGFKDRPNPFLDPS